MDDDRTRIDPENRYPAAGLLHVERHALQVLGWLEGATMTRTRDAIQIDAGDEIAITVLVTAEALELRLPTVEWTKGAYGPAPTSRLWKRILWDDITSSDIPGLLDSARRARRAQFRRCRYCGKMTPPEYRFEIDVCQSCASAHLGVVY